MAGEVGDPPKGSWGQIHIWGLSKGALEGCALELRHLARAFSEEKALLEGLLAGMGLIEVA